MPVLGKGARMQTCSKAEGELCTKNLSNVNE